MPGDKVVTQSTEAEMSEQEVQTHTRLLLYFGLITYSFTAFSLVFQSYQASGSVLVKGKAWCNAVSRSCELLLCCCFMSTVNIEGHVGTVS